MLNSLAGAEVLPDAILLNATVSGEMGVGRAIADIRSRLGGHLLPIILSVSRSFDHAQGVLVDGLAAGCNDYVMRPYIAEELATRIRAHMRQRKMFNQHAEALLLRRMLPEAIIERLRGGHAVADSHDCVSLLFTDMCGFTEVSSTVSAAAMMDFMNEMFNRFDAVAERHGVYKVAMIGDAYFAVCGHEPQQRDTHARQMLAFAEGVLEECAGLQVPAKPGCSQRSVRTAAAQRRWSARPPAARPR